MRSSCSRSVASIMLLPLVLRDPRTFRARASTPAHTRLLDPLGCQVRLLAQEFYPCLFEGGVVFGGLDQADERHHVVHEPVAQHRVADLPSGTERLVRRGK